MIADSVRHLKRRSAISSLRHLTFAELQQSGAFDRENRSPVVRPAWSRL
jgi:hypothetical protein